MKVQKKQFTKIIFFILLVLLLCKGIGYFVKPVWKLFNNYDTVHGFYKEPENTIETLFLGSSLVINGISPMELYEKYGICAYNLATEQQPLLASYYWAEEAYRLHAETLKVVVLDTSMLVRTPERAFYQKSLDDMHFSRVKYNAVRDYTEDFNETLSYLFPLFEYHSRWEEIDQSDFDKYKDITNNGSRGYNFETARIFDEETYDTLTVLQYIRDKEVADAELDDESLYYLEKLINFCKSHGIELVLSRAPGAGWTDAFSNAVEHIAEENDLEYFDFTCEPYIDEIGVNQVTDTKDDKHLNYYGAKKFTRWFGNYLVENCDVTDVRGLDNYEFMKDELIIYHQYVSNAMALKEAKNVADYLNFAMQNASNVVMISVKEEAANKLTNEQRERFREGGLSQLATLQYNSSYIGVIENGQVKYETVNQETCSYKFEMDDKTLVSLTSGGYLSSNISSCLVEDVEYSMNSRGINIVVYNKDRRSVIDSAVFDTHASDTREGWNLEQELKSAEEQGMTYEQLSSDLRKLYLYNKRCEIQKEVIKFKNTLEQDDFLKFVDYYRNRENTTLFLSVMEEATNAVESDARDVLKKFGLLTLSELQFRDSYIGIISDGEVVYEHSDHGEEPIAKAHDECIVTSGGMESGNTSSIIIKDTEHSLKQRGINMVVYDTDLKVVIDSISFDTHAVPMGDTEEFVEVLK